jgi:heptosyltransferase-2
MSLLIFQSGFLGDAVLASGMLRAIATVRPDVVVGMVVRSGFGELFEGHPALTRVHRFDKKRKEGMEELTVELKETGYDTVFLPHRSLRSALVARRAGIPERIGFRQSDVPWLLTHRVEYSIAQHETERNGMLLRAAGIDVATGGGAPWLLPESSALTSMQERFAADAPVVVIAPGSVWPTKRWTVEGYAEVVRKLADEGARVVLAGSEGERPLCTEIAGRSGSSVDVVAGELSLAELLALIAIASRVITNDSAPLHLAESVGTPVTAIFGPTVPEFGFAPRGAGSAIVEIGALPCRPCRIHGSNVCPIGTHECMRRIDAEEVLKVSVVSGGQ